MYGFTSNTFPLLFDTILQSLFSFSIFSDMEEFEDCNDIQLSSKFKHARTIIHIDLDCFYAQVEMLKNPDLASKPVGIKQQHYVITSNYVAREYGIRKCMLITEALALCPKLVIVNGEDLHDYRLMSNKVTEVIKQFSPNVEKLGLDENFVDVTDLVEVKLKTENKSDIVGHVYKNEIENSCFCGCRERLTVGSQIAREIRSRIKQELGMTCCAGIAHNKLLAKLVGPTHKPNQQTVVFPSSALTLVLNMSSARAIPGIGRKCSDVLNALGIDTVTDIQNAPVSLLEKHLGDHLAQWIKGASFGVDDSEVKQTGKQQVIGLEEASKGLYSMEDIHSKLHSLIERGLKLIQEDGRFPTTLRVSVRKYSKSEEYNRQRESKQSPINPSVFRQNSCKEQIYELALSLFKKLVDHSKPFHLTLIGLAFTKFQEELPAKSSLLQFLRKSPSGFTENDAKTRSENVSRFGVKIVNKVHSETTTSSNEYFANIDQSVLDELPEDIRNEILQQKSRVASNPGPSNVEKSESKLNCPAVIDPKVFYELPLDIQKEIIENNAKDKNKPSTSSSKQNKPKQNSILGYFKNK